MPTAPPPHGSKQMWGITGTSGSPYHGDPPLARDTSMYSAARGALPRRTETEQKGPRRTETEQKETDVVVQKP